MLKDIKLYCIKLFNYNNFIVVINYIPNTVKPVCSSHPMTQMNPLKVTTQCTGGHNVQVFILRGQFVLEPYRLATLHRWPQLQVSYIAWAVCIGTIIGWPHYTGGLNVQVSYILRGQFVLEPS